MKKLLSVFDILSRFCHVVHVTYFLNTLMVYYIIVFLLKKKE